MKRSTVYGIAGGLAFLLICAILSAGCTAQRVRSEALLPAIQQAYVGVAQDVERGIVASEVSAEEAATFREYSLAITNAGSVAEAKIALQQWPTLQAFAFQGIDDRVTAGEITEGVAGSLRERVVRFAAAVTTFLRR